MPNSILLINPVKHLYPPFGLLYIASSLEKAGFSVEIFEMLPKEILPNEKAMKVLITKVLSLSPCFVGITCMSAQALVVKYITKCLKERFPRMKIVIGGVHPTFMPHQTLNWGADFVVIGEGEKTAVDLAEYITNGKLDLDGIKGIYYKKGDDIISTGMPDIIENLDEIPKPAYHLISKNVFTRRKGEIRGTWMRCAWFWTSRGCPSQCSFCTGHLFFGKKVRFRSFDNIFKEIDLLVSRFRIEAFYIMDDTFTVKKEHVLGFCKRLKNSHPHLKWGCQARVNFFDEEIARTLKESGCLQVDFGVESGSQRILNLLKKGIKVEQTEKAFQACKKHNLKTLATIMIGNPTENTEDVDQTRRLLKKITPDFVAVYFTTPFPGTLLYDLAKKEGLISDNKAENTYTHQLVEPIGWTSLERSQWNKIYDEFSKWNIMYNYLLNPLFIFDISKFSILHPKIVGTIIYRFLKGNKKDAFQLLTEISFSI